MQSISKKFLQELVQQRNENYRTGFRRGFLLVRTAQGILSLGLFLSLAPALIVQAATSPQVEVTGRMVVPRLGHTATVLKEGRILIVGGRNESGILASAEIFDPVTRAFSPVGSINTARSGHAATLLPDGRVLISGGQNSQGLLNTVEIFETGSWSYFRPVASTMIAGRLGHTASLLSNGKVLIAGGDDSGTAELFDVERELFLGQMVLEQARRWHTATVLGAENVFLLGGGSRSGEYYRATEQWFRGWPFEMAAVRSGQAALTVGGGLLVIGGDESGTVEEMSGEDGLFRTKLRLGGIFSSATLLANGKVLVLGPALAQLYSPASGELELVEESLMLERRGNTATELPGEKRVLVVGGVNQWNELIGEGALYNPAVMTTDRDEYASGSRVGIHGFGFLEGEEVELEVARTDGKGFEGRNHWLVVADAAGGVHTSWLVCSGDCAGAEMRVSAVALTSGLKSSTTFRISSEAPAIQTAGEPKSGQPVPKIPTSVVLNAPSSTSKAYVSRQAGGNVLYFFTVTMTIDQGGRSTNTVWMKSTNGTLIASAFNLGPVIGTALTNSILLTVPANQIKALYNAELNVFDYRGVTVTNLNAIEVCDQPSITAQSGNVAVCPGQSATFTVTATGDYLTYQWRKNGVNIPGATTAAYTISSVATSDAAPYTCVVSSVCGASVTSTAATLTVSSATVITSNPSNQTLCQGANATFTVAATGGSLTYQWRKNGVNIVGATSTNYLIASVGAAEAGSYDCVVTSACGTQTSTAAILTVNLNPAISIQPVNQFPCPGGTATFSVTATGGGLTYQWKKNNDKIEGATGSTLAISHVSAGDEGSYIVTVSGPCGIPLSSNAATLTINVPPTVTAHPSAQAVCPGASVSFSVVGTGNGLTYRWRKDGTPLVNGGSISGATSATLIINPVAAGDVGSYTVVLSTGCAPDATSNVAALTLNTAPTITSQPNGSQTVCAGTLASFSVTATGSNLSYQWRKNATPIPGAIGATYTINSPVANDSGTYSVLVGGACTSSVTSSNATLVVNTLPVVTVAPASVTACLGSTASLSVTATGGALIYQWRKNTVDIAGATFSNLTINPVVLGDAGSYDVRITNPCGGPVTSSAATVTVTTAPAITQNPTNQLAVCPNATVNFTVAATGTGLTYQWRKGGIKVANGGHVSGATTSTLTISSAAPNDEALYDVVVGNGCAPDAVSTAAQLTLGSSAVIASQPSSQAGCLGSVINLSVVATGTSLNYQWKKAGVSLTDGGIVSGATTATLTLAGVSSADTGVYTVMVTGVCGNPVTSNPASLTIQTGTGASAISGPTTVCAGAQGVVYSTTALPGVTTYTWTMPPGAVITSGQGTTSVTVDFGFTGGGVMIGDIGVSGSCTSSLTITVTPGAAILGQPSSQTICAGLPVRFSVVGSGQGLSYQWRKNGIPLANSATISGVTSNTLSIASTVLEDAAFYDVLVTSSCGGQGVISTIAQLIVNQPAVITTQPASQVVCAGTPVTYTVVATGNNLTYQWRKNGVAVPLFTLNSFVIQQTQASDAGVYDCVVRGVCTPSLISSNATLTVNTPPAITLNPSSANKCVGDAVTFAIQASGTGLTYQWRKNAQNISGATSNSYTLPAVGLVDAGTYDVVVTGSACGLAVTSAGAVLSVNQAPVITTQPVGQTVCAGSTVNLTVAATGGNLSYQWRRNGMNLTAGIGVNGVNTATLTISPVAVSHDGSYSVVVSNGCGPAVTSTNAVLTVQTTIAITTAPGNISVCHGSAFNLTVNATGTGRTYQWRKNGTPVTSAGDARISGENTATLTVAFAEAGDAGAYDVVLSNVCNVVTSTAATVTTSPQRTVGSQTGDQMVCVGSTALFTVTLNASTSGVTYQWKKNGVDLANGGRIGGATTATLQITPVTTGDAGTYTVFVGGPCTPGLSSPSVLTVTTVPSITTHPLSQTLCVGRPASITVVTTGVGLTYQWRKDGAAIPGATGTTFAIASIKEQDAGAYDVAVTASACVSTLSSSVATLTVNAPPVIITQPVSTSACAGERVTFTVAATGSNLQFQWRRNNVAISGATSATYSIASVNANQVGAYSVAVTGTCAPVVISSNANLAMSFAPVITVQPTNQVACLGAAATFTVTATGDGVTYQWRKNGAPINGANLKAYTLPAVVAGDAGTYDVVISGTCGTAVTSTSRTLSVMALPGIATQPANQTVCENAMARFSVTATGISPSYQWRRNGNNLTDGRGVEGAKAATLNIAATPGMEGSYDVLVGGVCGSAVTSSSAMLIINSPPRITAQPRGQTICLGAPVDFSVAATGSGLRYQWRKNGVNLSNGGMISGATNDTLTVSTVDVTHAGTYSVVISGSCTPAATSASANLVVTKPLGVTGTITGPTNVCAGQTGRIYSIAANTNAIGYDWTVPEDARIMSGQGKNSITVTWGSSSGVVTVAPRNNCFTGTTSSRGVEISTLEITQQPSDQTALTDGNLSVTYTTAVTGTPAPTVQWQVSTNAGRTWSPLIGKTNLTLTVTPLPVQDGSLYRAVFKSLYGTVISSPALLTIAKIPATTAVTATPGTQQYSDKVTMEASVGPASAGALVPATNVTFYIGTRKLGTLPLTVTGDVRKATLANVAVLEAPGEWTIRAVFGGVSPYFNVDSAMNYLTVTAEDARAVYSGPLLVCANGLGNATVALKATILDVSALAATSGFDLSAGVISNARVAFVNRDTEAIIGEVPVVVGGSDSKVGTATLNWPVSLGSESSATYRVGMIVKNSYFENNVEADAAITVSALVLTQDPVDQTALTDCEPNVTFTAAATAIPAPTVQWQVSSTGGRTWSNLAGKTSPTLTFAPTPSQNGYKYRAVFKNLCKTVTLNSSAATLIVNKIATTSELSVTPDTQQYSDKVTVAATLASESSCPLVAATNVTFYIGNRCLGTARLVANGGVLRASLADVVVLEGPGTPAVRAVFTGVNPFFTVSSVTNSLTVNAEDARAAYIGPATVFATATGKATVSLKAAVKDITAVIGDSAFDANAGMIKNARVVFLNRDTDVLIGEVGVVAGTDQRIGSATLNWSVDIGTASSVSYNIGIRVKSYYLLEDSLTDAVVTVRKP
jgi:hypothetical protein